MAPTRNGPSIGTLKTTTTSISRLTILCLAALARIASAATTATATTAAATPTVTLPSQILQVVPACAVDCLATFVQDSYQSAVKGATSCSGTTPTFACLCEHTGANGFTIGEAAISCLTLEGSAGACTSTGSLAAAFDAVRRAAYLMCSAAAADTGTSASVTAAFTAAEQTHRTIVATAVVGTEFAVRNDAQTTTTTTVTTAAATHTTTSTTAGFSTVTAGTHTSAKASTKASTTSAPLSAGHTLTVPVTSLPTTLITAPAPSSPLAASPTSASNAATASNATAGSPSPTPAPAPPALSKGQIVGISVGSAAALLAAVCAYVALRTFRKRRDRESEFFGDIGAVYPGGAPSGSPKKDTSGFTRLPEAQPAAVTGGSAGSGHELQISSPMHLQQPAKYQTQTAFVAPWHETMAAQQAARADGRGAQTGSAVPTLQPAVGVAVAGAMRNPYAQQTPYVMPTIRPVNNTPAAVASAYSRPLPPRVLTAKALPSRPSPTHDSSPASQPYAPSSQSRSSQYPYPQAQSYARAPLPADWRPRPPQKQQKQQQQQQQPRPLPPLQPPSLQTMAEEDEEDEEDDGDGYVPPPPQARIFGPPAPNRDSVVTEFAEDGEDEYSLRTSGRGSSSRGVGGTRRATNSSPYDVAQPYMSPSLVPRPLAAQRLGDDRAAALRVGTSQQRRPTWQRRSSVVL